MLAQLRDDQIEELELYRSKLGEERIGELIQELKGECEWLSA